MARTLVINPGSSSKKYAVYEEGTVLLSMRFERTGSGYEECVDIGGQRQKCEGISTDSYGEALARVLAELSVLTALGDPTIATVVVRVVVPGTAFQRHAVIDDVYVHRLRECEDLAPLHVPHILREIATVRRILPAAHVIAASDSAFHATLPPSVREYSIPARDAATYDLYHFGYHGLSVASVLARFHAVVGADPQRTVIAHVGSGVSVTGVKEGKSMYTTMGYAPGSGLMMATRAGDIDTGATLALMRKRSWRPLDTETYLSTHGGLLAATGSADLRQVLLQAAQHDSAATVALERYVGGIARAIAAAHVTVGGADTIVFTATVLERSAILREHLMHALAPLGVIYDAERNDRMCSRDGVISAVGSPIKVAVIRTDEMGEMYRVGEEVKKTPA